MPTLQMPRLQLSRKKAPAALVGLEIEAGSVAAAEVTVNGSTRVGAAAVRPLDPAAFREGEVGDADALVDGLRDLFSEHKLAKQVRLGLGNQGVVMRTMRLPAIENPKELDAAIRFKAEEEIPMPLDRAVLDHQVIGGVAPQEGTPAQIDVVVVAARREMIFAFLAPLRRAGLEPVGVDLSAFAMVRALAAAAGPEETVLYCNVGDITNLAVARGRACLFTRVSHAGLESAVQRLAANRNLRSDHAEQWLSHVGLQAPVDGIEGDPGIVCETRETLEAAVTALVDELRLSLDYYQAQEGAVRVERVLLCGPAATVPGLPARMEAGLGLPIVSALPPALGGLEPALAARLTLPYGLALED